MITKDNIEEELGKMRRWQRESLAANTVTPEFILVQLAKDSNRLVLSEVAKNSSTPASVL